MINLDEMMLECEAALSRGDESYRTEFIEKWVPEVVNEINELRNRVLLLETHNADLQQKVEELEWTP